MRVVRASAWILLVLVGAVAAAGLVISLDHPPSGDARPELTARDAAILAPRLAAMDEPLGRLASAAQALSTAGRDVLVRLRSTDLPAVSAALDAGDAALGDLTRAAAEVRTGMLGLLEGLGAGERLPAPDRARVAAIGAVADAGDRLAGAWAQVRHAAAAPAELLAALRAHDGAVVRAAEHGRAERWAPALTALDEASGDLAAAVVVRDELDRAGRDVATLDGLLARLADHDAALRTLYVELESSGGVRMPAVDTALAVVAAAQAALLDSQDALSVAVTDAGAADITPALLIIEEVRGTIEAALAPAAGPERSSAAAATALPPARD